ncbi:uncharacterized protein B0I36DRAFT_344546 [Microdochium trichocladiopsis]|uniref:Uncharacterized protein n=1 Tax=Microdochium trichocladiopsis TaxID=1682393 RepID=A0A9P8YIG2_9PEZI|nr:uncharacterized protein B0I36DRAFT_344546 [Microdochium trichocladiopsis]KAH7040880.1 hypothetical protein B0I36DRAFT_344546 [Microdochium trichocladiopsis]
MESNRFPDIDGECDDDHGPVRERRENIAYSKKSKQTKRSNCDMASPADTATSTRNETVASCSHVTLAEPNRGDNDQKNLIRRRAQKEDAHDSVSCADASNAASPARDATNDRPAALGKCRHSKLDDHIPDTHENSDGDYDPAQEPREKVAQRKKPKQTKRK